MFTVSMKITFAENVLQAHLSGILAHKGACVAILNDNGTEFKNNVLKEVCDQLGINRLFSNPFHPQGNGKVKNEHNFVKRTLTKFLDNSNLKWDELLPFACYCYNIFPGSNSTESTFFLMFGWDQAEGCLSHLNNSNRYNGTNDGKIVLEELHKLWKHHAKHLKKCIKEISTCKNILVRRTQNLRLASQSWSRAMHVVHSNQSIHYTTEY